jgi:EAL domain-containing protein (putative c-di-GMP-specific phosphodiesterase class I)/GGDEF domain-containing protein
MIFAGNFLISIKNTKEYLVSESITKAQDTATSLGMSLKNIIKDKTNPEIETIIKSIANSGFYKEIRLENSLFTFSESDLIIASNDLDNSNWIISNLKTPNEYGKIEKITSDLEMSQELLALENPDYHEEPVSEIDESTYSFIPSEKYINGGEIPFSFRATNEKGLKVDSTVILNIDKILVQVKRDEKFDYVPSWFINLISLSLPEQYSEINDGWQKTAVIYVSANAGEAYAKLYNQVKTATIYSFIAFLISIAILFVFVQYLLKPLKKLEKLANNIAQGKFTQIEELPFTTEIKAVSIAFNDMSLKIENMIDKLNRNLSKITKKLSKDELTSLPLKQNFETDMKDLFINKLEGYVLIIRLFELSSFAKSHTNKEINEYIKAFANILKETQLEDKNKESKVYRFFGSEFAIIAKNFNDEDIVKFIKLLQNQINKFSYACNKKDIMHIGASKITPFCTIPELLQSATESYEKATLIGSNEAFICKESSQSRTMTQWKDLVFDIIDNSKFDVRYIGDCYSLCDSTKLLMQEAFTSIKDDENKDIPIGTFVSIAEKYEKIIEFDQKVITKVINHILINNIKHEISINLSLESINNTAFIAWLEKTILKHKDISNQLVFSVTAYAVAKDIEKFKFFVDEIHKCGAKVIMKRFETKFIALDCLKNINLDSIRLARDYTNGIATDLAKQSFVESIQDLANLLNIKVYAENVKEDCDFEIIKEYNLDGSSR